MSKVEELENQVRELSSEELVAFRTWLDQFDEDSWDRQLVSDAQNGKLRSLAERALQQHKAGESTTL